MPEQIRNPVDYRRRFFFRRFAPAARLANPAPFHLAPEQLAAPASHGVHIESQKVRHLAVAPVPQSVRLQAGIESPLAAYAEKVGRMTTCSAHIRDIEFLISYPRGRCRVAQRINKP
jgi:hypothetical protein